MNEYRQYVIAVLLIIDLCLYFLAPNMVKPLLMVPVSSVMLLLLYKEIKEG